MKTGIYRIRCTANNKVYIGSSQDIDQRWQKHKQDLARKKHSNRYLQNCYSRYGLESFEFSIVELCSIDVLLEREQFYLDLMFDVSGILNICRIAGMPVIGRKHSETTKRKIGESQKGKIMSKESRERMSKAKTGVKRPPMTEEQKQKIRDTFKRNKEKCKELSDSQV